MKMFPVIQTAKAGSSTVMTAFMPFIMIIGYLLGSGHASLGPKGKSKTSCCGDNRVERGITVFGGSSAFTFGLHWGWLANRIGLQTKLGRFFAGYAVLQFILSCVQTGSFLFQLSKFRKKKVRIEPLKAHLDGCGYTTGWSPIWPLFWLSKQPKLKWLILVRDVGTVIDWIVSLPFVGLLNLLTLPIGKKLVKPILTRVDHPH